MVPACISDETIKYSAAFRQGGRFPVLSYRHSNGVSVNQLFPDFFLSAFDCLLDAMPLKEISFSQEQTTFSPSPTQFSTFLDFICSQGERLCKPYQILLCLVRNKIIQRVVF